MGMRQEKSNWNLVSLTVICMIAASGVAAKPKQAAKPLLAQAEPANPANPNPGTPVVQDPPGPEVELPPEENLQAPSSNPGGAANKGSIPPPSEANTVQEEVPAVEPELPPIDPPAGGVRRPPIGQPKAPPFDRNAATGSPSSSGSKAAAAKNRSTEKPSEDKVGADLVPDGQELVNIDFPEQTEIKDIIRAVSLWTGKNVILGRDVSGKVQMISPKKVTKVEAYQAFLSALNLLSLTTVETGKVIKIVPVRSAVKSNLKTFLGSSWTPMTDEFITQIVPLKYINAKEIQTTLSRITSSNSMIAYSPTNTLIISDSGFKVRRILDIIELLDVQTQQPKVSIVPIKHGDAKAISAMVQDIFKAQTAGVAKGGSNYLTYKIMTDERTNAVVIFGPPRTIADVKELVRKFDVRVDDPSRQSAIHVRPLDYADAKKLAATLSALASGKSGGTTRRPPVSPIRNSAPGSLGGDTIADVAVLDNDVKITADESSNSLVITGSRAGYDALNTIIRKLDTRKSQVFVEAEILDINIGNTFKFGSNIFAGAKQGNANAAITWQAKELSPLIVAQASQNGNDGALNDTQRASAAAPFAEDFNIGILSGAQVDVPGLGKISPGALIKMIKTDANTRVLSSPHILTSNNETAKISVGDNLYYKVRDTATTTGISSEKVEKEKVSVALELKPNISQSNYVTMKIDLDASSGKIDDTRGVPSVSDRKTSQIVTVKNGQTVVVSGLVKTSEYESFSKIPLLGDIPIIGWLFRNSTIQKSKDSLAIFLTPYIVHGANDLAAIYEKKIDERDEILKRIYGSDFDEDDFYKSLPTKADGLYRADAFDVIDEKRKADRDREMMRDLGYEKADVKSMQDNKDAGGGDGSLPTPTETSPSEPLEPVAPEVDTPQDGNSGIDDDNAKNSSGDNGLKVEVDAPSEG